MAMALLAHYLCDEQDNDGADDLIDSSGHANDHLASLSIPAPAGFDHKMIDCTGNVISNAEPLNPADFRLQGDMTVCCWIQTTDNYNQAGSYAGAIMGYGDTTHETQAENFQWQFDITDGARFRLWWEHTNGVDVLAASPANALAPTADGFGGQTQCIHIAGVSQVRSQWR
jgi:hypothetical protein